MISSFFVDPATLLFQIVLNVLISHGVSISDQNIVAAYLHLLIAR